MKEIVYKYSNRGIYLTEDDTSFCGDSQMKIVVEPHDFSIAVGGETLRSSSCKGYSAVVSNDGEAVFYDSENSVIGKSDKGENTYKEVRLEWKQDFITVQFGRVVTVDYYPNCDGEYDRWGKEWQTQHSVTLNLKDNSIEIQSV